MPKYKNDQFIDKRKACVFKLITRDSGDPNYNEKTKNDNIWQVVSQPNVEILDENEQAKVNFIMSQFTDKEMGKFKNQKKPNEFNEQYKPDLPNDANLWINNPEFIKMKQEQEKLNNCDDDTEYIEMYDIEEIEEVDSEEIINEELKQDYDKLDDYQKLILRNKKVVSLKEYQVKHVKLKEIDEYGLPTNTYYNYQQHIADEITEKGGEVIYIEGEEMHYVENNDYEYKEMTEEQKEVFDALRDYEHEEEYEALDDDFLEKLKDGEEVIDQENKKKIQQILQPKQKQKQVIDNIDKVIQEFDECDVQEINKNLISNKDFENILDNHIQTIQLDIAPQLIERQSNIKKVTWNDEENSYEEYDFNEEDLQEIKQQEEEDLQEMTLEEYAYLKQRNKKKPKHTSKHKGDKDMLDEAFKKDSALNQKYGKIIPFSEDKQMQRIMEQDSDVEPMPEQPVIQELQETITTRDFNKSKVSENLTIITEVSTRKKNLKSVQPETIEESSEEEGTQVSEIYTKRPKNESKEEKKKRKDQIKEFKQQQKEKKKQFKEQLNQQKQQQQNKINKQTNQQQLTGVSIMKVT